MRKLRLREINLYQITERVCVAGFKYRSTCLLTDLIIPSWPSALTPWLCDLVQAMFSFFTKQWTNPPTSYKFLQTIYFQETDCGDILCYWVHLEVPKLYFVCFPTDYLNGALKYNDICLTERERGPGTATLGSPISEPIGGNLLREAWSGGEHTWSRLACL